MLVVRQIRRFAASSYRSAKTLMPNALSVLSTPATPVISADSVTCNSVLVSSSRVVSVRSYAAEPSAGRYRVAVVAAGSRPTALPT